MTLCSILATMIIAGCISHRPFRSLWMVLLTVFLAIWSGQIWLTSDGAITAVVSWYELIFVSVFVAVLTMVFIPHAGKEQSKDPDDKVALITGLFFWITMVLLIIFIGPGFYLFR